MANMLKQLREKSVVASQFLCKHGSAYYKQTMEQNKHHIVDPPTVETCQDLSKKLFFTRLASIPGRVETFRKEVDFLKNKIRNRQDLKIEELGVGALFLGELYCWVCVGEIVGRGSFLGYNI